MRAKRDAVVVEPSPALEAEDLEAARIGQDRAVPRHEAVQAACGFDAFEPRAQPKVVRVRQYDLRVRLAQFERGQPFDGRGRSDGHERRRLNNAVRKTKPPPPSRPIPRHDVKHYFCVILSLSKDRVSPRVILSLSKGATNARHPYTPAAARARTPSLRRFADAGRPDARRAALGPASRNAPPFSRRADR